MSDCGGGGGGLVQKIADNKPCFQQIFPETIKTLSVNNLYPEQSDAKQFFIKKFSLRKLFN
jgi:hypothetical protein